MQYGRLFSLITAVCFVVVSFFVISPGAVASPAWKGDNFPPGQAKKVQIEKAGDLETSDTGNDDQENLPDEEERETGPAWARGSAHPSVKGLTNAWQHVKMQRVKDKLAEKIRARGGQVPGEIPGEGEVSVTIEVYDTPDTFIAPGSSVELAFIITDRDGNAVALPENHKIKLQVTDENGVLANEDLANGRDLMMSDSEGITETIILEIKDIDLGENEYTLTATAVLYNDEDGDSELDDGEKAGEAVVNYTIGAPVLAEWSIYSGDEDLAFTSDITGGFTHVAAAGNSIDFYYQLLDQNSTPINVTEETGIVWTVENNGDASILITGVTGDAVVIEDTGSGDTVVTDVSNNAITLEPGEKVTIEQAILSGSADSITVSADLAAAAVIDARMENNAESSQSAGICFFAPGNELASNTNQLLNGTVEAFDPMGENDGTRILLLHDGEFYYAPAGIVYEEVELDNGSSGITEEEFEDSLNVGDTLLLILDDKNEGETGDYDEIRFV